MPVRFLLETIITKERGVILDVFFMLHQLSHVPCLREYGSKQWPPSPQSLCQDGQKTAAWAVRTFTCSPSKYHRFGCAFGIRCSSHSDKVLSLWKLGNFDVRWLALDKTENARPEGKRAQHKENKTEGGEPLNPVCFALLRFTKRLQTSSRYMIKYTGMIANQQDAPVNSYHFVFLQHSKNILQLQSTFDNF